jgi:iron complex outermembrane recepter protein
MNGIHSIKEIESLPSSPLAALSSGIMTNSRAAAIAAFCLSLLAVAPLADAGPDDQTAVWQQRLAQAESQLRQLSPGDTAVRERLATDLARLRQDVAAWLATYPPAQQPGQRWLESPGAGAGVEELAAEVGRLRAAILRIRAATEQGGDPGAFYLGRVDVAVTATTTTATTDMTPAGATVLDAQDFRMNDRRELSSALALAPGVTFTRIGSRNEGTVYVRGYDMRQVPMFIDGIPVYTPYDGYADLDRFTTFDTAEVRISKGFASVLYGPNALGGAINIVSRRPTARFDMAGGGSYGTGDTWNSYVNAGSRLNSFYLQGGASYLTSDTFPLADGFSPVTTQPSADRRNAYRRDGKFNVKMAWTPRGTDEYAVSYVGQRGEKGNPPYAGSDPLVKVRYWQWPYWDKDSVYFVSNTHLGSTSYLRGRAFYDTYDNALHSYDDATYTTQAKASSFQSIYRDRTYGASMEWGATLGRHTIRAAGHIKQDLHQDHNVGEPVKELDGRIGSVGVEDTIALSPALSLVGGVGGDWQTTTKAMDYQKGQVIDLLATCRTSGTGCGDTGGVNPQVGLFYAVPTGQLRFTASHKTRMPSLKDRYSYKMGAAVPNPDLKAEYNLTFEGGYQGTLGSKTSFMASVFYSRIDDAIQRRYLQPNLYQLQNIGEASNAGFELDARTHLVPRLDLGANYTYLKRENISDPSILPVDTPRHKGRVSVAGTITASLQVIAGVDCEAGRKTQNEASNYFDVPAFATMDVKGVWTIRKRLDAELALFNAFDKYYWVADGYPEPGRTVMVTLRFRY